MILRWLRERRMLPAVHMVYTSIVRAARQEVFHSGFAVPDTLDGRFDLILLHMALVVDRLRKGVDVGDDDLLFARRLQEVMIEDMDRSLREMGVGDLSVGKQIKKMGAAWLGRLDAYSTALERGAAPQALEDVLARNLYRQEEGAGVDDTDGRTAVPADVIALLAGYVRDVKQAIDGAATQDIRAWRIALPAPPRPAERKIRT
ncbi:cytochrome b pre-mRNA-processing protein 3 [Eilatimonas milleporae]|uniref:Cytochrome b pre-mRNA-processing protein 3 n=2 Tax=Eilatimonas milleporae TaxID=911205 RepID=A0A3M0CH23_9PROT|nr:cytochrome b pre-mRNA-processing protein 3 [Eilatimonas milleporae]